MATAGLSLLAPACRIPYILTRQGLSNSCSGLQSPGPSDPPPELLNCPGLHESELNLDFIEASGNLNFILDSLIYFFHMKIDIDQIKRLVIIALASDDELMERLVLKGGNAIQYMNLISKKYFIHITGWITYKNLANSNLRKCEYQATLVNNQNGNTFTEFLYNENTDILPKKH